MTDRIHAVTVLFTEPIRTDDAEPLLDAIRLLRGVASVEPHIHTSTDTIAEMRARQKLAQQLWAVLYPETEVTL